jgi:hypothetical protein
MLTPEQRIAILEVKFGEMEERMAVIEESMNATNGYLNSVTTDTDFNKSQNQLNAENIDRLLEADQKFDERVLKVEAELGIEG